MGFLRLPVIVLNAEDRTSKTQFIKRLKILMVDIIRMSIKTEDIVYTYHDCIKESFKKLS